MENVPLPKFRLSLLARFELAGPDGPVDLPNKKLAGLLAYLACTAPVPQPREKLATLLWGSHFDTQARQNLRQALFRLRRALGEDALISDGEEILLGPGVFVCDATRLEALIRQGSRASLAEAVDLYKQGLLADVAITEEAWADWVTSERQRLEGLALDALVRLGEIELELGDADKALETAHRALAINDLREDAHRLIVEGLSATGRKAEALKHYQDLVTLLKRELNTEPDAATKSLVAELRSTQPPSRSPAVRETAKCALPQPDQLPPTPRMIRDSDEEVADKSPARGDAALPTVAAGSTSPERRQLTIMVCTMVGAMSLSAGLDPEDIRDQIGSFHETVADVVARFDGFVAQHLSDGVVVYFGYPLAREHDAEQAVRAGLAILDAVGSLNATSGVPLRVRGGIATGLVVVGEQLGTGDTRQCIAIGEAPTMAAQLQAVAAPGEIVVATSTRRLVGGMFDCHALAADKLKGLPRPVEAWQVRGETAGVSRFEARHAGKLSPLVGRQEEMDLLLRRWDQAKLGEGRVVLLSGEPGIGKSRIAESLLTRLEGEPHGRLRYFCSPHHTHSPLYPFIAQLERVVGFEPGSSAATKLDKLEALLEPRAKNAPRDVSLIAELLEVPADGRYPALTMSPQQKREMTLTALLDQLDGVATQSPVLIVFEDAHWIDPTSLDLLDRTIARIADLPVLLVVTFRAEFQPAWVGQPHVTMLPLSRLGRRDSAGIIGGVTKGKMLPDTVVEQVLAHADGVPLFIEELTSTLLESGVLRERAGGYVHHGPLPPLAIPTTLQASLVARLDRLATVKGVAQIGAAIGREFSDELIGAVAPLTPGELDAALERLTASGLISRRGTPPGATYSFKHALVQDAAYVTMLKSRRQQLHERIAKVLVERFPAMAERLPEVVAHHFAEAGFASEAIGYWLKAGERAVKHSAHVEAVKHLTQGMGLIQLLPTSPKRGRKELALHLALGPAITATKGYSAQETLHVYSRARDLLGDSATLAEQMIALWGLWNVHWGRAEHIAGLDVAKQCRALALRHEDAEALALANRMMGITLCLMGAFAEARRHLEGILGLSTTSQEVSNYFDLAYGHDNRVVALSYLARVLWPLGYPEQAATAAMEAVARARAIGHAITSAVALHAEVVLGAFGGDLQRAATQTDEMVVHCIEHSLANFENWARFYQGAILARRGDPRHGIEVMRGANTTADTMNAKVFRPLRLGHLAAAHARLGQVEVGLDLLGEAIQTMEETGERFFEAELYRLRGEMCLTLGRNVQAETALKRGLIVARHQQARIWELRTATSLARLWHDHGRSAEARDLLTPIYDWFTEGFDLPDLKHARSVLDGLIRISPEVTRS
jgi:class 3 adenylate cyclase/DNA-binding SARP family transcriptional activator/predicted ATPase